MTRESGVFFPRERQGQGSLRAAPDRIREQPQPQTTAECPFPQSIPGLSRRAKEKIPGAVPRSPERCPSSTPSNSHSSTRSRSTSALPVPPLESLLGFPPQQDEPDRERNWNNWELWEELLGLAARGCVITPRERQLQLCSLIHSGVLSTRVGGEGGSGLCAQHSGREYPYPPCRTCGRSAWSPPRS